MAKKPIMGLISAIVAAALGLALLLDSKEVAAGVAKGLALCAETLVPALFPFMVFACWLSLKHSSRSLGAVALLSFVGGYPVGAKSISLLLAQNRIGRRAAERMLCFCVNAGPPFVITAVGAGMLGSRGLGAALLAGQVCASVAVGIFVSRNAKPPQERASRAAAEKMNGPAAFVAAVSAAGSAVLNMCAYTALFSGAIALVTRGGRAPAILNAVAAGLLEVASGCAASASLGGSLGLALVSACLSFGGLSVWFQVMACFQGMDISFVPLLKSRFAHAAISVTVTLLLAERLGGAMAVFAPAHRPAFVASGRSVFIACCLLVMCGFLTFDCREIDKNMQKGVK